MLPDELIREIEEGGLGFSPEPDGLHLERWEPFDSAAGQPVAAPGGTDEAGTDAAQPAVPTISSDFGFPEVEPVVVRVVPWSEVGVDYELVSSYDGESPTTTTAWTGDWNGQLTPATLPAAVNCCAVTGTETGYLALTWGGDGIDILPLAGEGGSSATSPAELVFLRRWGELAATGAPHGLLVDRGFEVGRGWRGDDRQQRTGPLASGAEPPTAPPGRRSTYPGFPTTPTCGSATTPYSGNAPGLVGVLDLFDYEEVESKDFPVPEPTPVNVELERDGFSIQISNRCFGGDTCRHHGSVRRHRRA